jgi:hypothetical protein
MTMRVNGPNGIAVNFPDGTDPSTIDNVMRDAVNRTEAQQRVQSESGPLQDVDNRMRAVARGVPLVGGAMDEISAGLNTGFGYLGDYNKELAYQRERDSQYDQQRPIESNVEQLGGGVLGSVAGARAIPGGLLPQTMKAKIATGIGAGAAIGGEEGFTRGEGSAQNRMQSAIPSAEMGAAVGGVVPLAAGAIGRTFAGNPIKQIAKGATEATNAAQQNQIKAGADKIYSTLRSAGIHYDPESYQNFVDDVSVNAGSNGYLPERAPGSFAILNGMSKRRGTTPDWSYIEATRQQLGDLIRDKSQGVTETDRKLAGLIKDQLDNFTETAPLTSGSIPAPQAAAMAKQARELSSRVIKARMLEDAKSAAESGGYLSGDESGYRNQLGSMLKNKSKRESLSPAEQQAVAQGIHGGTANRLFGSAGRAGVGGPRNFLGPIIAGHIGGTTVGAALTPILGPLAPIVGGAATIGAASASKKIAEIGTKRAYQRALATVLAGRGEQGAVMTTNKAARDRAALLANALLTSQGAREAAMLEQPSVSGR